MLLIGVKLLQPVRKKNQREKLRDQFIYFKIKVLRYSLWLIISYVMFLDAEGFKVKWMLFSFFLFSFFSNRHLPSNFENCYPEPLSNAGKNVTSPKI